MYRMRPSIAGSMVSNNTLLCFLLGLLAGSEGGSMSFRKMGKRIPDYTVSWFTFTTMRTSNLIVSPGTILALPVALLGYCKHGVGDDCTIACCYKTEVPDKAILNDALYDRLQDSTAAKLRTNTGLISRLKPLS